MNGYNDRDLGRRRSGAAQADGTALARKGRQRLIVLLGALLVAGLVTVVSLAAPGRPPAGERAAAAVGAFTLPALDGGTIALTEFVGRPVLLNFFATWCGPCAVELPMFQAAAERHRDRGLAVLLVNVQEDPVDVRAFLATHSLSLPVALDPDGEVTAGQYHVPGLPATFFISAGGNVRVARLGPLDEKALDVALEAILPSAAIAASPANASETLDPAEEAEADDT